MKKLVLALCLCACAHVDRAKDATAWIELRSDHFEVRSDLPEADARAVVQSLEESRAAMKQILSEIQSGEFAREWIAENKAGGESFDRMRKEAAGHEVEEVGHELRDMMPWIDQGF